MANQIKIHGIDFDQLRKQKNTLIYAQAELKEKGNVILDEKGNELELSDLDDIISLIDHIQDQAVNQLGLDPDDVYHFPEEE